MALLITEPDVERLALLHRFVRTPAEGEHLRQLEEIVTEAEVLEPERIPPDVVTMKSRVLVRDLQTGETAEYTLVFPSGVDARRRCISVLGALGSKLLGRRVGDVFEYVSSAGRERCRLEKMLYQPEAAGDFSA
jgi:regulator of nucleoside diphosphate kinase